MSKKPGGAKPSTGKGKDTGAKPQARTGAKPGGAKPGGAKPSGSRTRDR